MAGGRSDLPENAFRFDLDLATFAAGDRSSDGARRRRFRGNAHTGRPMRTYAGNVAVDLSTLRFTRKDLPVLRDHDAGKVVGYTEKVEKSGDGILVEGHLVGVTEAGREVISLLEEDVPLQMSVYVPPERVIVLADGEETRVNGHTMTGPGYVLKGSTLREVTITALGADDQTRAAALGASPRSAASEVTELVPGGARFAEARASADPTRGARTPLHVPEEFRDYIAEWRLGGPELRAAFSDDFMRFAANRAADDGRIRIEDGGGEHRARERAIAEHARRTDRWGYPRSDQAPR